MQRTRIKICGITRPEDALAAARAGADAVGMVFYESARRCITLERAKEIVSVLPAFVTPVALFVDADPARIREITRALHIRHIQLHGNESPHQAAELGDLTILKAIPADPATLADRINIWRGMTSAILLETPNTGHAGGSGIENDWDAIEALRRQAADIRIIAAGGLRPETVGSVVRRIRPYAVDVSSGVESTFGIKSAEKIDQFIGEVRSADSSN